MALDICFDVQTFLERTCRSCSRYFSEEINSPEVRFHTLFENPNSNEEVHPNPDVKAIYDELQIWNLNIKPSDGLPQQICNDCFERFLSVKSFREECIDTQKVLESYFKDFDHLIENASQGRISPKAESVKSVSNEMVNAALTSSPSDGSPKLTYESPKYNDIVYAESSIGTPPPIFEEIKTEPIDMQTLDNIKAEAELQTIDSPKPKVEIEDDNDNLGFKPIPPKKPKTKHYTTSDDESSTPTSDEDTDEEDVGATTENDDESLRKRTKAVTGYDPRNPLQCRICFAAFPKRSILKEHHLRAHPQEKPYVCNICDSAFKSNFLLRQHQLKHNRPDTIKCDLCGKYFRSQLHLQRHAKNFHLTSTYTCHICHEKFENYTQIRFQYHVRQHGEKRFHCQYCEKSFHQKIHLINHERTHSKEQPFCCNICGKSYRQQTACQEHTLTHTDPTPFKCKVCQKGFTQRSSLRLHLRTHETEKQQQQTRYHCAFCGQNFIQKVHYEMHQLTHGNAVFSCHHCNVTFKKEAYLESHIQSMHTKKRKCAYCGEVFPNDLALKSHLNTHAQLLNTFKCKYCDTSFPKQQALLLHEEQHKHGEREKFLYLSSMERDHMPSTLEDRDMDDDILNYNFNDATTRH